MIESHLSSGLRIAFSKRDPHSLYSKERLSQNAILTLFILPLKPEMLTAEILNERCVWEVGRIPITAEDIERRKNGETVPDRFYVPRKKPATTQC